MLWPLRFSRAAAMTGELAALARAPRSSSPGLHLERGDVDLACRSPSKWPWRTSCRAAERDGAKPRR